MSFCSIMPSVSTSKFSAHRRAFGAYLRQLRDAQRITQPAIGERLLPHLEVKSATRQIQRWESGETEPELIELVGLLDYLKGTFADVEAIFRMDDPSEIKGAKLAVDRLAGTPKQSTPQPRRSVDQLAAEIEQIDDAQYEEIMRRLTGLFGWAQRRPS